MSEETNALLALQDAWNGAVETSGRVKELAAVVHALPEAAPPCRVFERRIVGGPL